MSRALGDIMLDIEVNITEMVENHDLQWGDVLNLIHGYLEVHRPDAQEEYVEGGHPIFFYGPEESLRYRYERNESKSRKKINKR